LALLCVAALPCADGNLVPAAEAQQVTAPAFPVASDARLAGDGKQTRFVLDLDKTITFRAFTLADPYRVVVDVPQVDFRLPIGTGATGRGLIKAFRYGLVMPGGSRIVIDLTGPARIANTYMLDAANGQPPRLVLEFEQVDQATFAQSLGTDPSSSRKSLSHREPLSRRQPSHRRPLSRRRLLHRKPPLHRQPHSHRKLRSRRKLWPRRSCSRPSRLHRRTPGLWS
jgi:hypothetical protein